MRTATEVAPRRVLAERALRTTPRFYLLPRDGWLTLLLTVLVIYITVVSVQSVQPVWASGLDALTGAMALGILLGYIATQQNTIANGWMHTLAIIIGVLGSFQLTANTALDGDRGQLLRNTVVWFQRAFTPNGSSADNSVFLLFLTTLTFLLAYMTMWLVFHARRPWLAVVANAVVLLINLNQTTTDEFYFLIVFLVLTLLLLVRFTLAENMRHWRRTGLRFSPDLGWDFMQAGAIFAVIVALLPNLLPIAQPDPALVSYWNSNRSPLAAVEQRLQSLFSGVNGHGQGGLSFFGSNLPLVGNVDLPSTQVLHYTVTNSLDNDPSQYLVTEAFSTYDGLDNWTRGQTTDQSYNANQPQAPSTSLYHLDTYNIIFDAVPTGGERFILAPGSNAASFSISNLAQLSVLTREPITWLAQHPLSVGDGYTATGYVSTASANQLESIPYPEQAATAGQDVYPQPILEEYLPVEPAISPEVAQTAQNVTKGSPDMYQAALALQDYLRTFTYNAHNPNPPAGKDSTVWFLQRKEGFCTFFASAMALMGRSLGMPTRIVSGYTGGSFDEKTHTYIVRGSQAHTWTQIYFGKYGWINFEPTSSFTPFFRPQTAGTNATAGPGGTPIGKATQTPHDSRQRQPGSAVAPQ
ncbi:MAG TPA: transglutaminase-like domain-containing protein, partial [Ktedonobacterales bacterium]